jgi:hypothetical protein
MSVKVTAMKQSPKWIEKLKARWKVKSAFQVIIILVVFACTGTTIALIKRPIFNALFPDGDIPTWIKILYWIMILPIYNIVLLIYGFIFGQFKFFWEFEKRMFKRMMGKK